MRTRLLKLVALGALLAPGSSAASQAVDREDVRPDRILLQTGKELEGRVLRLDADSVLLEASSSRSRRRVVDLAEVETIEAALIELPQALTRLGQLDPRDRRGSLAEAATLAQKNLPLEAELLYWQVLAWNPEDSSAHQALGHRRRGTRYVSPLKGRWYTWDRLIEERDDWGSAWEFSTTHFELRTNLPLNEAVGVAFALERGYQAFFELFGEELDLIELTDPMLVTVHADEESYQQPGGGRRGYFSSDFERLSFDASQGVDYRLILRELTHALLYESSLSVGGAGELPGWLVEGLAQYMESAVHLLPRRAAIDADKVNARLFSVHAHSEDAYRMGRVLTFDEGDFWSSSRTGLKYAQAYTLVYFCLFSGGGRLRAPFLDYVKGAFVGKGSSTHFKKALGIPERELEAAWKAYSQAAIGK